MKTEHAGSKKGCGAYHGSKAGAKWDSTIVRRRQDKKEVHNPVVRSKTRNRKRFKITILSPLRGVVLERKISAHNKQAANAVADKLATREFGCYYKVEVIE